MILNPKKNEKIFGLINFFSIFVAPRQLIRSGISSKNLLKTSETDFLPIHYSSFKATDLQSHIVRYFHLTLNQKE
jgi:hypothetical protein